MPQSDMSPLAESIYEMTALIERNRAIDYAMLAVPIVESEPDCDELYELSEEQRQAIEEAEDYNSPGGRD